MTLIEVKFYTKTNYIAFGSYKTNIARTRHVTRKEIKGNDQIYV